MSYETLSREIDQLGDSITRLSACIPCIQKSGINPTATALLEGLGLLDSTAITSLGLESFGYAAPSSMDTAIAVEGILNTIKEKAIQWAKKMAELGKRIFQTTVHLVTLPFKKLWANYQNKVFLPAISNIRDHLSVSRTTAKWTLLLGEGWGLRVVLLVSRLIRAFAKHKVSKEDAQRAATQVAAELEKLKIPGMEIKARVMADRIILTRKKDIAGDDRVVLKAQDLTEDKLKKAVQTLATIEKTLSTESKNIENALAHVSVGEESYGGSNIVWHINPSAILKSLVNVFHFIVSIAGGMFSAIGSLFRKIFKSGGGENTRRI